MLQRCRRAYFMVGRFMVTQVPSILVLLLYQIVTFRYTCAARDYAIIQILIHSVTPCQHTPMTEAWTCFNLENSTLFKLIYKENKDVLKSCFWCEIQPKASKGVRYCKRNDSKLKKNKDIVTSHATCMKTSKPLYRIVDKGYFVYNLLEIISQ